MEQSGLLWSTYQQANHRSLHIAHWSVLSLSGFLSVFHSLWLKLICRACRHSNTGKTVNCAECAPTAPIMLSADSIKSPTHTYIWHRKCNFIPKNIFSHHLSPLLNSLGPFCDTCGIAGASKVACNNKIPAASLGCAPLPAILYMSPGLFKGGLLWEPRCREMCLRTLTHTWHARTCVYTSRADAPTLTHTHPKRNKCEGSVAGSGA